METISFARGVPAPECLPVEELADCARVAIEREGAAALLYGHTLGYQPLREWIAEHHDVDPARVVVTNGSLQAFHFVLGTLGEGRRIVVERPTYDRPRKVLSDFDEVAVDDEGLDVDGLERRLAELAADGTLLVFEDDPYGLVRFEGELLPSVFGLAGGRNVVYSSSFSKTIAPGLRVGYVLVPDVVGPELEDLVASTYITPALVSQAIVLEFLRRGLFEPNLERVCGLLRARRDAMLDTLERELGGRARWSHPAGGYFLWLELGETDAAELLGRASQAGVTFVPGVDFGGGPSSARLAFSFASPAEIEEGVARLATLVGSPAAV